MFKLCLLLFTVHCALIAQSNRQYRIETRAGTLPEHQAVPAAEAILFSPREVAIGRDGTVFVSDARSGIRRISADGLIFDAGSGAPPAALTVDETGTLYSVLGPELYTRKLGAESAVTSRPAAGVPALAPLTQFSGIAPDRDGNVLLVDRGNRRVLRVGPDGRTSVVAGAGSPVPLNSTPVRIAVDGGKNIYISQVDWRIIRISPEQRVTTIAGNGSSGAPKIGAFATESPFGALGNMATTDSGELFFVDERARSVLRVDSAGVLHLVWEGGVAGIAFEASGRLVLADPAGRLVRLESDGSRAVIAGLEQFGGDDGLAREALMKSPAAVALDATGAVFIGDAGNNRIRKLGLDGIISTVAGTGTAGFEGDGEAGTSAQVAGPDFLAADEEGNLYFASRSFLKVRKLRADGVVETVAGTGEPGSSGDGGPATEATFNSIDGLAVDNRGRLFISESNSHRVRVVSDGTISTYAGTGTQAAGEDSVAATASALSRPALIATDSTGNLLIYEMGAQRLRRVLADTGIISTVSRMSPLGRPGDEQAVALCIFTSLSGLAYDRDGAVLVSSGTRICRLTADGSSWVAAGTRLAGFSGDGGSAASALLWNPSGLSVAPDGSAWFADTGNHRVRRLSPEP